MTHTPLPTASMFEGNPLLDGCAVDTVEIARVERMVQAMPGELDKLFSRREIEDAGQGPGRVSSLAARFAAKEAFSKALGTGIGKNLSFLDFEVLNQESGKPYFLTILNKLKKMKFYLSISDDYPWAVAFVIASK